MSQPTVTRELVVKPNQCRRRLSTTSTVPPQSPLDDSVFLATPAEASESHSKLVVPLKSNCLKVSSKTSTSARSAKLSASSESKSQKTSVSSKTPDRHSNNSGNNGCAVCRICHGSEFSSPFGRNGRRGDPLISPCDCSGTMGLYHRSCLEQWLSVANSSRCEICRFQYTVTRTTKPMWQFVLHPGENSSRRSLIADFLCYLILSPLAVISCWLCISGAVHYANVGRDSIELPGLICLAAFLLMTYTVWLIVSCRYHQSLYKEWKKSNMVVTLIIPKEPSSVPKTKLVGKPIPEVETTVESSV